MKKNNLTTKKLILILSIAFCMILNQFSYAEENVMNNVAIMNIDPYYSYWNGNFIVYVDNYSGDKNNVSKKDLNTSNGTSCIYLFTKLKDKPYSYDDLVNDLKNNNNSSNLHDVYPILVHLPKSAKSFESHAKFASDSEVGKLMTGGPYSKYEAMENGFYYKDKKLNKTEINELLSKFSTEAKKIKNRINQLKTYSILELYPDANVAMLTNGASTVAGTPDAKIYFLNIETKFSPYQLSASNMKTTNILKGEKTIGVLDEWQPETLYIYHDNNLLSKITFEAFQQLLWSKQDPSAIKWFSSLK